MQLIIDIPDEFDDRILEAFGSQEITQPIHMTAYKPATMEVVGERLKNYIRSTMYAYEDNRDMVQTSRQRSQELW